MKNQQKEILDQWIKVQMKDQFMKDKILANEGMNHQSDEFLTVLLKLIEENDFRNVSKPAFDNVKSILTEIFLPLYNQVLIP
jgi:hypothetical protein